MLIKLDEAIAAVDKHYDEMWRSRQHHQAEGNEESVGRLDARCRTASQIAEALRALPTVSVSEEMVERAARALCEKLDAIENDWHGFTGLARAALEAALGATVSDGWEDIARAPRDGTFVDLWIPAYGDDYRAPNCLWLAPDNNWWMSGLNGFVPYPPTHWRPLPAPPTIEEKA